MRVLTGLIVLFIAERGMCTTYKEWVENLRTVFSYSNFQPHIRPDFTVNVSLRFSLNNIFQVSPEDQKLSLSGALTMSWTTDTSWLEGNYGGVDRLLIAVSEDWKPDLVIENVMNNMVVLHSDNLYMTLHSNGTYVWELPLQADLFCSMDLKYFPFDNHTCEFSVTSFSHSYTELQLQPLENSVNILSYKDNPIWSLTSTDVSTSQVSTFANSSVPRLHPKITFTFHLEREESQTYSLTLFLPMALLSGLMLMTFFVPSGSQEKVTFSAVVCLSYLLLYVRQMADMPHSESIPVLSIYLTTVLIKICLHVLCVVIVMHIYHKAGKVEMSTVYRKVTVMLVAITCMRRPQPNISETLTEKTELNCSGETEVSDHTVDLPSEPSEPPVLHAQMSRGQRPHGHLSPIPGNKISPQNGQVRSGSSAKPARSVSSAKSASVKSFSAKNDGEMSHWRQLSAALERLLFVVFLVVTCLVHFIFLMVLGLS